MLYSDEMILQLPERFRVNLINSLSGYKSANLIGSRSDSGLLNVALFSSVFHVGANPPLMGLLSRPHSVPRHTLENIKENGEFTINSVAESFFKQAHHCSARSQRDESEFAFSGLTPAFKQGFGAPAVEESPLKIYLRVAEITPIKANDTVLIIGEVINIDVPAEAVAANGTIDHKLLETVSVTGLDNYHRQQTITTLEYAKQSQQPQEKLVDSEGN